MIVKAQESDIQKLIQLIRSNIVTRQESDIISAEQTAAAKGSNTLSLLVNPVLPWQPIGFVNTQMKTDCLTGRKSKSLQSSVRFCVFVLMYFSFFVYNFLKPKVNLSSLEYTALTNNQKLDKKCLAEVYYQNLLKVPSVDVLTGKFLCSKFLCRVYIVLCRV